MWYIYILKSFKGKWYYVGSTNRLSARVKEHNSGKVQSTKAKIPLQLVYSQAFDNEIAAREYERKIKGQRILKETLIKKIEKENLGDRLTVGQRPLKPLI